MKVYSDSKGAYILLRNLAMQTAGFKAGTIFNCKILEKQIILEVVQMLCYCGHEQEEHRLEGKGECRNRDHNRECGCEKFRETSFLEAIGDRNKRLIKIIEQKVHAGVVIRLM